MKVTFILTLMMLSSLSKADIQLKDCSLPTNEEVIQLNPYEEDYLVMEKPAGRCDSFGVTESVASCTERVNEKRYSCYQITEGTHVMPQQDYRVEKHQLCFRCR